MRTSIISFLLAVSASCTIIADDDPVGFGVPQPAESGGEEVPGVYVCNTNPGDANDFTLTTECREDKILCEARDSLPLHSLTGSACCVDELAGSDCVAVSATLCDGTPSECPNGYTIRGECPGSTFVVCDY